MKDNYNTNNQLDNLPYFISVQANQLDENAAPFSNIQHYKLDRFFDHPVPYTFDFSEGSQQVLKALQAFKPGTTQKFKDWNTQDNIINHRTFTIDANTSTIVSRFKTAAEITIQTELISAGGANGDSIGFADPWLVDLDEPPYGLRNQGINAPLIAYSSPLNITTNSTFKGVFLNQNPDPNDPTVPYYSVRAEDQTINGIDYFLDHWSGSGVSIQNPNSKTTAVVFTSPNAVVTANLKGRLASGLSGAIVNNNQRKMVYDENGNYHLVYEDNGEIYYTTSTDNGATWSKDLRLSDGNGYNLSPSIDKFWNNGQVVVVWQKESNAILMRRKAVSSWQAIQTVAGVSAPSSFRATPAVIAQGFDDVVVWRHYDPLFGSATGLRVRTYIFSENMFGDETALPSTNSNSMYPSLAEDRFGNLHLAWAESGKIYYTKFDRDYDQEEGVDVYTYEITKEDVSSGTGFFELHNYPSITTDYFKRPNITWQARNGALYNQAVLHRRRETSGSWSSATSFEDGNEGDYFKPNIMSFPNVQLNQKLRVTWRRYDNKIWLAKYTGSSWSDFSQSVNGFDPNLSANPTATEAAKMVYRSTGSAPYTLATTSQNLSKTTGQLFVHHRGGVLRIGKSEIVFELGAFEVGGVPVNLFAYADTLVAGHTGQWDAMFRTEPFTVSGETAVRYFRGFGVLNPDSLGHVLPANRVIKFRLEAVDAQSGQVLTTIDQHQVTNRLPAGFREIKALTFHSPVTKNIYLRVGLSLPPGIPVSPSMVEMYYEGGGSSTPKSTPAPADRIELLPLLFEMAQNYPNPFNPTTTISIALPTDSPVKLEIFDISGRKVRTLVSGNLPAGRHEIVWDGRNAAGTSVSSGVYLYRMNAGAFVQSRKMMLMR